jgi:hypothetical protein
MAEQQDLSDLVGNLLSNGSIEVKYNVELVEATISSYFCRRIDQLQERIKPYQDNPNAKEKIALFLEMEDILDLRDALIVNVNTNLLAQNCPDTLTWQKEILPKLIPLYREITTISYARANRLLIEKSRILEDGCKEGIKIYEEIVRLTENYTRIDSLSFRELVSSAWEDLEVRYNPSFGASLIDSKYINMLGNDIREELREEDYKRTKK